MLTLYESGVDNLLYIEVAENYVANAPTLKRFPPPAGAVFFMVGQIT